jgi:plastocyanin
MRLNSLEQRRAFFSIALFCSLLINCGGTNEPPPQSAPSETQPPASAEANGYQVVTVSDGGGLAGTISVSGAIPKLPVRRINKDPQVCGSASRASEELIVSSDGGLKNAVVIVQGVTRGKAMPVLNAKVDQAKCEYVPHVQVMVANSDISIVNSDPVLHNIHFYQGDTDLFNIAQPIKGQTNTHKIEKTGFVYAECDVHGWMRGHVAVVDNPYYAITDERGKFTIEDLPAGSYSVKIWHEFLGEQTQPVTVASKADSSLNVDMKDLLAKKMSSMPAAAPTPASAGAPVAGTTKAPAGEAASSARLAASTANSAAGSANALSGEATVQMVSEGGSFRFEPANITVKAGTTVKWVNASDNRHSATDDPKFEKSAGMAVLPMGGAPWSTAFISNGQETTHTFTTPGKYQYFCRNHGQFGMIATVTVVP